MEWSDETMKHLNEHIEWPARGTDILESFETMPVPEEDRRAIEDAIDPDKVYDNVKDVISDVKQMQETNMMTDEGGSGTEDEGAFEEMENDKEDEDSTQYK